MSWAFAPDREPVARPINNRQTAMNFKQLMLCALWSLAALAWQPVALAQQAAVAPAPMPAPGMRRLLK